MSVSLYRREVERRREMTNRILDEVRREVMGDVPNLPHWDHRPMTDNPVTFRRVGNRSLIVRGEIS